MLQVLRPLAVIEAEIRASEPHVIAYFNGYYEIYDGKHYLEAGFKSFATYCKDRFPESFSTIKRALQSRDIRKQLLSDGSNLSRDQVVEKELLVKNTSDDAIRELSKVPPNNRSKVLAGAAKASGGSPSKKDIQKEVSKQSKKKAPEERPRFTADNLADQYGRDFTPKPPDQIPLHPAPTLAPSEPSPLPRVQFPEEARSFIAAYYKLHQKEFNVFVGGTPMPPFKAIDMILAAFDSLQK